MAAEALAAASLPKAAEPEPAAEPAPEPEPQAAEAEAPPAEESAVHEVVLSEEWAAMVELKEPAKAETPPEAPPPEPAPSSVATEDEAVELEALFSAELAKPEIPVPAAPPSPPPATEFELPIELEAPGGRKAPPKEEQAPAEPEPLLAPGTDELA